MAAEALRKDLQDKFLTGKVEPKDILSCVDRGVNISKLMAGLAAAFSGLEVNTAATTGGNAAENNAFAIPVPHPALAALMGSAAFLSAMSKADWKKAIESAGNSIEKLNEIIREKIQEYQQQQATNNPGGLDGTPLNPPDIKTGTELVPPKVDTPTAEIYPDNGGTVPQLPGGTSIGQDAEDFTTVTPIVQRSPWDFIFTENDAASTAQFGTTPHGRPLTKHYETETGPLRNIPGSVIDNVIETTIGLPVGGGKTVYYDPVNNVTVVTGDKGSIVSARKGKPRGSQAK